MSISISIGSFRGETDSGGLRVLEDWNLGSMKLSAVFVSGRAANRAARPFTDYLIDDLRDA